MAFQRRQLLRTLSLALGSSFIWSRNQLGIAETAISPKVSLPLHAAVRDGIAGGAEMERVMRILTAPVHASIAGVQTATVNLAFTTSLYNSATLEYVDVTGTLPIWVAITYSKTATTTSLYTGEPTKVTAIGLTTGMSYQVNGISAFQFTQPLNATPSSSFPISVPLTVYPTPTSGVSPSATGPSPDVTTIELGLIAALIAVVIIAAIEGEGITLEATFTTISTTI